MGRELEAAPRATAQAADPNKVRELAQDAAQRASQYTSKAADFADAHLPVATIKSIVDKALDGTLELTFNPALRSASAERSLRALQKKHPQLRTLADLKQLDLADLDRFRRRKGLYVSASAAQGGTTSIMVTGAVVSTTVSGGVAGATVVAALAADTVASLAMMGRSVGSVATRYGYDVGLPDEEVFAMGVLSLGMASNIGARAQALAALSRLTQEMMRRATWKQLNEHVLVNVITRVYQALGLKLTQRKLGQTVPVVGVGVNAALSANMTANVYQRAEDVYRLRFLSEKYDIDPKEWLVTWADAESAESAFEDVPDVAAILDEEKEVAS